jgi:hypothetical protein
MILRILPFLSAVALAVPLTGCIARGSARITNVIPLQLQEGANLVPHLAPDGRQGLVVEGRQPMARSPVIMTMLPRAEGTRGWDVVSMEDGSGTPGPTLDTHGRSVVFARAKVGGMPATLLFTAEPDPADPAPAGEPRRILIRTLRLQLDETSARFRSIGAETTRRRYCSGNDALAVTYRMALPDDAGSSDHCNNPAA